MNVYFNCKTPTFYTYHYINRIPVGTIVLAELRNKEVPGIVIGYTQEVDFKTKPINVETEYVLSEQYIEWILKVSEYCISSVGDFLKLCLIEKDYTKREINSFYSENGQCFSISRLLKKYGKRIFQKELKNNAYIPDKIEYIKYNTNDQAILSSINLKPMLIYGPTGSGKTKIYLEEIKRVLIQKKQVLLMLPEVLLSEYFCERVFEYLGFWPHLWNHKTHELAKKSIWEWAISGESGLIVGSRSSLWLPFKNLELIVIDEENDYSYKQENSPIYNARDMAILRAKYESINCLLVSATPSLETWNNVLKNKYSKFEINKKQSIDTKIIELKSSKCLSDELMKSISCTIDKKEQCLIFLNRKGFSSSIICSECFNILQCNYCSVNVTFYKNNICHCSKCSFKKELSKCSKCGSNNWNLNGIGIEQVEEMLKKKFTSQRIVSISSENINQVEYLDLIYKGEIDIIICTQVLAKGYTFPKLTLVAVLEGGNNLLAIDPRSNEKIYQLLNQVRGRSGRSNLPSTFIIQNQHKNIDLINDVLTNDYPIWAERELIFREEMNLPPFKQIIRFIVKSSNPTIAKQEAQDLFMQLKSVPKIKITSPTKASIYKISNQFRYIIVLQNDVSIYPQRRIIQILNKFKSKKNRLIVVDVDPYNFT